MTVLVTGAAGTIGSAAADRLREDGHRVVGLDLRERPASQSIEWISHDLFDTDGTERLFAESPLLDGLRHVVAVAGGPLENEIGRFYPDEVAVELFAESVRLNLVAQYAIVRGAAARIEAEGAAGDRSITLFSSINAMRGYGMPGYSSAKAGLLGLVVALALPLGHRRVRINAITPGTVVGDRFHADYPSTGALAPRLVQTTATGVETSPEDVARAVVAVVGMRQLTGQQLVIDGGQLAVPFDQYPVD